MRIVDIGQEKRVTPAEQRVPDMAWIGIEHLVIDDDYQRPLLPGNWRMIRKIAENFSWGKFTPVIVAPVGGGKYAIIDGQNRSHAAKICGFTKVPAMIVELPQAEQASAFSWINGNTTRITGFHIYKAALAAREDWAVRSDKAVAAARCRLMTFNSSTANKKSGEIYALALVRQLVEKGRDDGVTAALGALRAYDSQDRRVALYSAIILRPWMAAVCHSKAFADLDLLDALKRYDPFRVISNVEKMRKEGHFKGRAKAELERSAFVSILSDMKG